jgi:hypothetical protein
MNLKLYIKQASDLTTNAIIETVFKVFFFEKTFKFLLEFL